LVDTTSLDLEKLEERLDPKIKKWLQRVSKNFGLEELRWEMRKYPKVEDEVQTDFPFVSGTVLEQGHEAKEDKKIEPQEVVLLPPKPPK
jgi:hypothetical protein